MIGSQLYCTLLALLLACSSSAFDKIDSVSTNSSIQNNKTHSISFGYTDYYYYNKAISLNYNRYLGKSHIINIGVNVLFNKVHGTPLKDRIGYNLGYGYKIVGISNHELFISLNSEIEKNEWFSDRLKRIRKDISFSNTIGFMWQSTLYENIQIYQYLGAGKDYYYSNQHISSGLGPNYTIKIGLRWQLN